MNYKKFLKSFIKWVLILIALIIVSKAANTYYASYLDEYYEKGENGIIIGAEPILIETGSDKVVLLLHGLNGNPSMWKDYVDFLTKRNISVYAPLIAGHGTSVFDLEKTTYFDWIRSAEDAYLYLEDKYDNIYIGGASMGGLLTLKLASIYDFKGVVAFNTPIYFTSELVKFVSIVTLVQNYYIKGIFSDDEMTIQKKYKSYLAIPYKEALEMISFVEDVKSNVNKIEEPVLVIQSLKDNLVDPKSSLFILSNIKSKNKELLSLGESTHINITSKDQILLSSEVYKFIMENE